MGPGSEVGAGALCPGNTELPRFRCARYATHLSVDHSRTSRFTHTVKCKRQRLHFDRLGSSCVTLSPLCVLLFLPCVCYFISPVCVTLLPVCYACAAFTYSLWLKDVPRVRRPDRDPPALSLWLNKGGIRHRPNFLTPRAYKQIRWAWMSQVSYKIGISAEYGE